jgi:hypothetical protein
MEVKEKQHVVIKFLLLEGQAGEEIAIHRHDVDGEAAYSTVF